jgi:hypothetical protein
MSCSHEEQNLEMNSTREYSAVYIHYVGSLPAEVYGPVTGTFYRFSSHQPVQPVDPRDAIDFLVSCHFRLAR